MPKRPDMNDLRIGVVGLGYVGLPLALAYDSVTQVIGFDVDTSRVAALEEGRDPSGDVEPARLAGANIQFTSNASDLASCNIFIITVPTPIDASKRPDLSALESASRTVGAQMSAGTVVIYESTVYPGTTEDFCVPVLEAASGLTLGKEFSVGYSPERVSPGKGAKSMEDIVKITSGSSPETAAFVDALYKRIMRADTHPAPSIRVAEAAKAVENIQRDVNIALINELALLFKELGMDTHEVLAAAGSKWNFHPYTPGLVGGHCIGVDPYYMTHKAQSIGMHLEIVSAARRINDRMATYVADDVVKMMLRRGHAVAGAKVLVAGYTFKENCTDIRNTKAADLVNALKSYSCDVTIYDPLADLEEVQAAYGHTTSQTLPTGPYKAIVLAVSHDEITNRNAAAWRNLLTPDGLIYDVKAMLPAAESDARI